MKSEEIYDPMSFNLCTENDFSIDDKAKELYNLSFKFFPMQCIDQNTDIKFMGTDSTAL